MSQGHTAWSARLRSVSVLCRAVLPEDRTFVDRSYEAIYGWFHQLKDLFELDCQQGEEVAVDETNIDMDGEEVYVRVAVDCETLEVLAVEVSLGQSGLDALVFLEDVLERCRGRPVPAGDHGP